MHEHSAKTSEHRGTQVQRWCMGVRLESSENAHIIFLCPSHNLAKMPDLLSLLILMSELPLQTPTPQAWLDCVLENFDAFLLDHAAAEKKAAGMALSMLSHYPDRTTLVTAMTELAVEEMVHFREVVKLIHQRQLQLAADQKDPYVNEIRTWMRQGTEVYLLDRLLTGAVIEARGAERFGLVADGLPNGKTKTFYRSLANSEARHFELFLNLAGEYFDPREVEQRWNELIAAESQCMLDLPIRAALH